MTTTKPYQRRSFTAGNARAQALSQWRSDRLKDALAALVLAGGVLSGTRLGELLGISPRGLRPLFVGRPFILAERRGDETGRAETWYRLDFNALPKPCAPPLLSHAASRGPVLAPSDAARWRARG